MIGDHRHTPTAGGAGGDVGGLDNHAALCGLWQLMPSLDIVLDFRWAPLSSNDWLGDSHLFQDGAALERKSSLEQIQSMTKRQWPRAGDVRD